jgi:hypothetical protein
MSSAVERLDTCEQMAQVSSLFWFISELEKRFITVLILFQEFNYDFPE